MLDRVGRAMTQVSLPKTTMVIDTQETLLPSIARDPSLIPHTIESNLAICLAYPMLYLPILKIWKSCQRFGRFIFLFPNFFMGQGRHLNLKMRKH
jgi:hypothetical protein